MGSLRFRLPLLLVILLLAAGVTGAQARTLAGDGKLHRVVSGTAADADFVAGQVIVQFRAGVTHAARGKALAAQDARAVHALGRPGLTLVRLRQGESVRSAVAAFERDPSVVLAEPNYLYRVSQTIPNDTNFACSGG